jgi:hypothetical protein
VEILILFVAVGIVIGLLKGLTNALENSAAGALTNGTDSSLRNGRISRADREKPTPESADADVVSPGGGRGERRSERSPQGSRVAFGNQAETLGVQQLVREFGG